MKVATVMFTYNRSWHTSKTLEALKKNYELPEKLFIFQDGIKDGSCTDEWEKVNHIIKKSDFCPIEVIVSEKNKGLSKSVMDGIAYAFQNYDAIIVLEDDCVPSRNFMGFMNQALSQYENIESVYNVTGYGYANEFQSGKYDAYFIGRVSSWGWGTWKSRWKNFVPDAENLKEIMSDEVKSKGLAMWGNDLPEMMAHRLEGKNDSWAVYWAIHVMNKKGLCLAPFNSLIENIGMDGTGVHCGKSDIFNVTVEDGDEKRFSFPSEIELNTEASSYFIKLYGGCTAVNDDSRKKHVIIYGLGNYFKRNEEFFCRNYYIECFIDRCREGYYAGKKIIKLEDVQDYPDCQILVLIIDMYESEKVIKMLNEEYGIDKRRISRIGLQSAAD